MPTAGRKRATALTARAINCHRSGKLEKAEKLYRRALATDPEHVDALHFLGVLLHQRGRTEQGISLLEGALRRAPDCADARNNLGNILMEAGRLEEAVECYRAVLERRPDTAPTLNNLGAALRQLGRTRQAVEVYERAVELSPEVPEVWANYGNALTSERRLEEALAAYRRSIDLSPGRNPAYASLGRLLHRLGRSEEAAEVYRSWLVIEPQHPIARHLLAASGGGTAPMRASDEYVRQLFDDFAGSFDAKLEGLRYEGPELVASAIRDVGGGDEVADILDAGCGTGLCGPHLRPLARRLVGVDLSPAMIEKARAREVYDQLIVAELTDFLSRSKQAFDLIASADTVVYFGDLEQLMNAAARCVRPGGCLVFTVEKAASRVESGFELEPHGRYSHTREYVEATLRTAGLSVESITERALRLEEGKKVAGLVVSARRPR
jgi:predicted TPR repeat methyltransferase